MASRRLVLLLLVCAAVSVQSQSSRFPSNRFSSRKTSSSVSSEKSPGGRTSFSRTSTSESSSSDGTTVSRTSTSRGSSRRQNSGRTQTTSRLASRAGGFSSGRPNTSRASSSSSSTSSGFNSRRKFNRPTSKPVSTFSRTKTTSTSSGSRPSGSTSSSRRKFNRPTSKPVSTFSRTKTTSTSSGSRPSGSSSSSRRKFNRPTSKPVSSFSRTKTTTSSGSRPSGSSFNSRQKFNRPASKPASAFSRTKTTSTSSGSRPSSSPFNRQRVSTTKTSNRPTFGANRRKTTTNTRQSSSSSRFPSGGSSSAFTRGSSSRGGSQKKALLKQASTINFDCPEEDGFFADKSQCDKYIECKEGVARERTCPDGLLFHPERSYPCVYPVEADCTGRSAQQESQPTSDCPRQFATFRAADDEGCGAFTRCINGRAFRSGCPEGLAFDARTLGCEYADEVEGCDVPAYLGFECPAREFTADQVGEFTRERHPTNCTKFYVCVNKADGSVQPRLQGCSEPAVFDPVNGECNNQPQEVAGCEDAIPATVLAAYQQRDSDEKDRRASRLAELRTKLQG